MLTTLIFLLALLVHTSWAQEEDQIVTNANLTMHKVYTEEGDEHKVNDLTSPTFLFGSVTNTTFLCALADVQTTKQEQLVYVSINQKGKILQEVASKVSCQISDDENELFLAIVSNAEDFITFVKLDLDLKVKKVERFTNSRKGLVNPLPMSYENKELFYYVRTSRTADIWQLDADRLDKAKVALVHGTGIQSNFDFDTFERENKTHYFLVKQRHEKWENNIFELDINRAFADDNLRFNITPSLEQETAYMTASVIYDEVNDLLHVFESSFNEMYFLTIDYSSPKQTLKSHLITNTQEDVISCNLLALSQNRQNMYMVCTYKGEDTVFHSIDFETGILDTYHFDMAKKHFNVFTIEDQMFLSHVRKRDGSVFLDYFTSPVTNMVAYSESFLGMIPDFSELNSTQNLQIETDHVFSYYLADYSAKDSPRISELEVLVSASDESRGIYFNESRIIAPMLSNVRVAINTNITRKINDTTEEKVSFALKNYGNLTMPELDLKVDQSQNTVAISNIPYVSGSGNFSFLLETTVEYPDKRVSLVRPVHLLVTQCLDNCQICKSAYSCSSCYDGHTVSAGECVHDFRAMLYVIPIFTSLSVILVLCLVAFFKYHWHLMFNLIHHYQLFALVILILQSIEFTQNSTYRQLTNFFPMLFLPAGYLVLPGLWVMLHFEFATSTYWSIVKVYAGAATLIFVLMFLVSLCMKPSVSTKVKQMAFFMFKSHYFTHIVAALSTGYTYYFNDIDHFDWIVVGSTGVNLLVLLGTIFKLISTSGAVKAGEESENYVMHHLISGFSKGVLSMKYHVLLPLKLLVTAAFAFMILISYEEFQNDENSNVIFYMASYIAMEVFWLLYLVITRPAKDLETLITEIVNFIVYCGAIAGLMYKFIHAQANNFDQSESYHVFTAVFFLMLPWVYLQLILLVFMMRFVRKKPALGQSEEVRVDSEVKPAESVATDSTLEENLNGIQ